MMRTVVNTLYVGVKLATVPNLLIPNVRNAWRVIDMYLQVNVNHCLLSVYDATDMGELRSSMCVFCLVLLKY